ncbi:MAG: glutathione S-transferase family protein [Sphingomonas sp.]
MIVYGATASPFVQRVLMAARAKGHELDVVPPLGGHMRSPEFRAISPMGRVPVLELDDGRRLCESDAIANYLDETLSGPSLVPGDAFARARMRALIALGNEVAAGMRPLMVHLVFGMGEAPDVIAAARTQLGQGLDAIERFRDFGDDYAVGDRLTQADCLLLPILALSAIVDPQTQAGRAVRERPGVAAYYDRVAGDPLARRTIDEMQTGFAQILARNANPA